MTLKTQPSKMSTRKIAAVIVSGAVLGAAQAALDLLWPDHPFAPLMEQADIPAMPVNNLSDLPSDPHLAATGFFQQIDHPSEGAIWTTRPPIRFSATPARHDHRPAPGLGEHDEEIFGPGGE